MPATEPVAVVDALGKPCPVPVIELAKAVERAAAGEEVVVLSDDAGAKVDIPVWCRMKGHDYLGQRDAERGWSFRVRVLREAAAVDRPTAAG